MATVDSFAKIKWKYFSEKSEGSILPSQFYRCNELGHLAKFCPSDQGMEVTSPSEGHT